VELKVTEKLVIAYRNNITFVVVGCGGTGGYLVRDLARIIGVVNKQFNFRHNMLLIDGDKVEPKNLNRQNFISEDLSINKAEILAARYSAAYGIDISFLGKYIKTENLGEVRDAINSFGNSVVLIGCVDNNKTRHMLHDLYRTYNFNNITYVDGGNEEHAGQVVISTKRCWTVNGADIPIQIQDIVELFALEANDKHPDEVSCAEHAVSSPQDISTNMLAAQIIFGYCNSILVSSRSVLWTGDRKDKYKSWAGVRPISGHVTYFDSRNSKTSTQDFSEAVQTQLKEIRLIQQSQIDQYLARCVTEDIERGF
jgi:molybdopterin/thiamine biosynthesis adenylyltransferase